MAAPKKNNRINNILKDLTSQDEKKIFTAIKQLRKHGKKEAISTIIETLAKTNNNEIKQAITNLLFDLKDQSVAYEIIKAIESDQFRNEKALLISIFWQSSLDGSQYISTFIREAIKGDYLAGIEVLSVLDNFDATFQEDEIEHLKFDLDEAIEAEETEKENLLITIKATLDTLNVEF